MQEFFQDSQFYVTLAAIGIAVVTALIAKKGIGIQRKALEQDEDRFLEKITR